MNEQFEYYLVNQNYFTIYNIQLLINCTPTARTKYLEHNKYYMLLTLLHTTVWCPGECVCDGVNWSGLLCDECSETFYGPNCLPLLKVLQVAPDTGPDVGGIVVHVLGHNFPNSTDYLCRWVTKCVDRPRGKELYYILHK